MIFVDRQFHR